VLDLGCETGQRCVGADVLGQAADVFNRNENSLPLRIIQLEVLGTAAIVCLQQTRTHIATDTMGGVDNQFARLEWRGELR
jgi:hypothetical protein